MVGEAHDELRLCAEQRRDARGHAAARAVRVAPGALREAAEGVGDRLAHPRGGGRVPPCASRKGQAGRLASALATPLPTRRPRGAPGSATAASVARRSADRSTVGATRWSSPFRRNTRFTVFSGRLALRACAR